MLISAKFFPTLFPSAAVEFLGGLVPVDKSPLQIGHVIRVRRVFKEQFEALFRILNPSSAFVRS